MKFKIVPDGAAVGSAVGAVLGAAVGFVVGAAVGFIVGAAVGEVVGSEWKQIKMSTTKCKTTLGSVGIQRDFRIQIMCLSITTGNTLRTSSNQRL